MNAEPLALGCEHALMVTSKDLAVMILWIE
jgi:hypothetical protein